jgi:lipoprotein NlpI
MDTRKYKRIFFAVIFSIFVISLANCYALETAEDFFKKGKEFSSVNGSDHAIYNYSQAIKLDPKMVKAYNNRGVAYVGRQQYDLAIADFTKVIKLDPKNGKAYNNRAIAYLYKKDMAKARQDIQKAQGLGISVNPELLKIIQEQPPPTR